MTNRKYIKSAARVFSYLLLLTSYLFVAACSDDDAETANVGLGIKVFFPTKVVTNQPITINGSGFSGATEIVFPNGIKVTDFEIVNDGMIRVNAPEGIAAEGGKIIVRTAGAEAESSILLTVGHTNVTGFSKQPGETASGGELITVYGTDLEFINAIELLDADGNPLIIDQKDFYRKGTDNLVFRVPPKNIFEGTFTGYLLTYDGQRIPIPEMTYEPAADGGHMEVVKTIIWENGGQLGEINWSSTYRFAGEGFQTGEECFVVPADEWSKMKTETFYATIKGSNPQIEITDGWWSARGFTFAPGSEQLTDNGDGTWTLAITLPDALLNVIDVQHLLFTGSGYSVEELYFAEEIWVDGDGGGEETMEIIWENGGSLGEINWSSTYRFAGEGFQTGEECFVVPADEWSRMKSGTFYATIKGDNPQIEITDGWWSARGFTFAPGSEQLTDNGDGTWALAITLPDALLNVIDSQHLLFTGSGYSVENLYFK